MREHSPGLPVHIPPVLSVFSFSKSIHILRWKASRYLNEHVTEGESRHMRIPTAREAWLLHIGWCR